MNNTILTDGTVVYYALKVNGVIVSSPVSSRHLLEQQMSTLPLNERATAQIVPVTSDRREVLLG